jgi:2-alkenal reductase
MMKRRISTMMMLVALVAVLITGCSLADSATDILPVGSAIAETVQQLPTIATEAQAAIEEVAQTQPTDVPVAQPTQPEVIPPVPVETTIQEQLFIDLYNRVNPGVVSVYMASGGGSGFIVDADGYIVTNNHVIAEGGEILVVFHNGDTKTATLLGTDPQGDIALLKVDAAPGELTALPLGDSDALQVGQLVVAIGSPFGLANSMSTGIVSGLDRAMPVEELGLGPSYQIPDVIQTDAAINPGNSGGPLLNLDGEVVGVNTAIESPVRANSGVGFAVPANVVRVVIGQLRQGGEVRYPWLGISGGTLTPEAAEELGLTRETRGVLVSEVTVGGPAAAAGLRGIDPTTGQGGDVITSIDGQTVTVFDDLLGYIVQRTQVGQTVNLTILRDGQPQTLSLTLGERPDTPPAQQQQQP